jgi:hypothetical protein
MSLWMEIVGWLGAALVLVAYALVSNGRVSGRSGVYQSLNVAGAFGLMVNAGWNGAIPSAVVNVIWIGIGLHAVRRIAPAANRQE